MAEATTSHSKVCLRPTPHSPTNPGALKRARSFPPQARRLVPVVIAIVPVTLVVPPLLVLIPPAMVFLPALLPRLVQFAPFVIGLAAVSPVPLNRLVQLVLGVLHSPLASLVDIFP